MKRGLAFIIVLLSAFACADELEKAAEPTAPSAALKSADAPAPASMRGATVCLSYGRDRELVRSKLKKTPNDEKLQKEFKSLENLILDAC
jgi:hypothetical protein